jgi:hypothetical protein
LQDGFALANFRFDKTSKEVVRINPADSATSTRTGETQAATRFLVYKYGEFILKVTRRRLRHPRIHICADFWFEFAVVV